MTVQFLKKREKRRRGAVTPSSAPSRQKRVSGAPRSSRPQTLPGCSFVQSLSRPDSLQPRGLSPARLLCPGDSPGKNTGVGSHFLLQGIFPIQGLNLHLLVSCTGRRDLYHYATWKLKKKESKNSDWTWDRTEVEETGGGLLKGHKAPPPPLLSVGGRT